MWIFVNKSKNNLKAWGSIILYDYKSQIASGAGLGAFRFIETKLSMEFIIRNNKQLRTIAI